MFSGFFEFVNVTNNTEVQSVDDFLRACSGKSFLNGLYRIHNTEDMTKWNEIVGKTFPQYMDKINVFGYDWLGRNFAIDLKKGTILLFEPGTGEVFDIPVDFEDFHNIEIAQYHEDSLASAFFNEWYEVNNHYILKHNQCAGYKIPLFLNGEDDVENLEISDMEVYWEIMMPLIHL